MKIVEKRRGAVDCYVGARGKVSQALHAVCRVAVIGIVLVAGCESDQAKYTRLRHAMLVSCLAVDPPASTHTPSDEERAACAVAQRKYNRFMAGR